MKSQILCSLSLGAMLLASGCSVDSNNDYNTPSVALTPAQAKVDAKILGGIIVIDKNEMAEATEAQSRAATPAVKNYAAMIYSAHGQNLKETQNVSQRIGVTPENGHVAMMLQKKGRQERATLSRLHGNAFDRAYIAIMVKDHEAALQLINNKLLHEATNPLVKRHLEITRNHVIQHLQQAKAIQQQLAHS